MNLNDFMGGGEDLNPHQIAWLQKDWDAVDKLADEFKEDQENFMFSVLDALTNTKIRPDLTNKEYDAHFANNAMSQHVDCLYSAYVLNMLHELPAQAQADYYLATIRAGKRYGKWAKVHDNLEEKLQIMIIQKYYSVNAEVAKMYRALMINKDKLNDFLRVAKGICTDKFIASVTSVKKDQNALKKLIDKY